MNCRKNVKSLGAAEKAALVQAFLDLKNPSKAPSQVPAAQARGATSRYDDYVWLHTIVDTGAHRRPGFLAWHRKYIELLEKDLQTVSGNATLALPYWDWADAASNPFTTDLLGGEGDGADNRVTTGAFAYAEGNWTLNVPPEDAASVQPYLQRDSPFTPNSGVAVLPTPQQVLDMLAVTPQDMTPWDDSPSTNGFRNQLEGWFGAPPVRFHNAGHVYVGGSMLPDSSPNDPVFFLHHANVDRLWAVWQQKHAPALGQIAPYVPGAGESASLAGHRLGDNMAVFGAFFGANYIVDSVLDHKAGGYMYDTDIPSVTLDTPSVDFGNVPAGATTYHAVRFRVETARQVRFHITGGPSGNFSQTPVTTFTAEPVCGEPFVYGYVFVAYTAPNVGGPPDSSSVTIEAYITDTQGYYVPNPGDDLSLLTVTVDLLATPVPVQKTAVALVLDRSGSMADTATTSSTGTHTTKAGLLKDAVSVFAALMRPEDGVGVVGYDDLVDRLLDVAKMGPYSPVAAGSGRAGIDSILAGVSLDPRGLTGIGAAILEANDVLADGQAAASALSPPDPYDVLAMVVMTDGNENQSPTIDNVSGSISANTFAVGLGTAGNVSEVALEMITKNNNGDLLITGDMSSAVQEFFLTKLFIQVLAGVTNQDIILDPRANLLLSSKHRMPFDVTDADIEIDVIGLSHYPALLDFALETPDGTIIQRADAVSAVNITYVEDRRTAFYRIKLPALPADAQGSHAGRWHALMRFDEKRLKELLEKEKRSDIIEFLRSKRQSLAYQLIVQTRSNLHMSASVQQSHHEPGATLEFRAALVEYNQPVDHRAQVRGELTRPDGSVTTLSFAEYEPGRFRASTVASVVGVYTTRIIASGRTLFGRAFTREQLISAAVHLGADSPRGPSDGGTGGSFDERLCKLLECIMNKAIQPEFAVRLNELGINLDALRVCIKEYCAAKERTAMREPGAPAGERTTKGSPIAPSATDRALFERLDKIENLFSRMAFDRESESTALAMAQMPESKGEVASAADQAIVHIPSEGFYTTPMAGASKRSSKKK
ncbi:tyrosinase family protein [Pelagibius marinus]|uniref:tyrosinase family protein n=1 Tax=Pelagibius marinus TaxID=2762760 RepID=UPI001872D5F2|nr:tyrosinase family protein [Pelagibius marinus]